MKDMITEKISQAEIEAFLQATGAAELEGVTLKQIKDLEDGTYVLIKPLLFHWTMIRGHWYDTISYFDRWCYANRDLAEAALSVFPLCPPADYEPAGWHRHPKTARRRPDGDPAREYRDP